MISIRRFMDRFSDEEACRRFLIRLRWPKGFVCPRCGDCEYSFIQTRRLYECAACRAQVSVTSGTIMHRTRLPLRYWLLVLYWAASGERCSARKVAAALHIQYRTALRMLHAVRVAMGHARDLGSQPFAFWMPARRDYLRSVNTLLTERAERFIRTNYRSIRDKYRTRYFREYLFRSSHAYNAGLALRKLLQAGAASIRRISYGYEDLSAVA